MRTVLTSPSSVDSYYVKREQNRREIGKMINSRLHHQTGETSIISSIMTVVTVLGKAVVLSASLLISSSVLLINPDTS